MIPHCEAMQGQRSIERGLHQLADAGYEDLRLETMRVDASGDRATEVGRYSAVVRLGKGRTVSDGGNYLASWRRLGAWRMAVQCFSSSIPRTWQDAQERQLRTLERPEVMPRDVQRPA
jgi:ketosteroid isomerase-like protein